MPYWTIRSNPKPNVFRYKNRIRTRTSGGKLELWELANDNDFFRFSAVLLLLKALLCCHLDGLGLL